MKSRLTLYMTLTVIAGFAIIMAINALSMFGMAPANFISPSDVRGMAVEQDNKLWTLNFEQQNSCIEILNRAFPITFAEAEPRIKKDLKKLAVKKLIIYRFNAPDIEVEPVGYVTKTFSENGLSPIERNYLLFSVPAWNPNGLLEEATQDQIQELLTNTYDH